MAHTPRKMMHSSSWTCDQQVPVSVPTRRTVEYGCGQAAHVHVPTSASSKPTTWNRPNGSYGVYRKGHSRSGIALANCLL